MDKLAFSSEHDEPVEATQILDQKQHEELMALRAQQTKKLSALDKHIVVMFTDLVGSTQYYERYGDLKGREKVLTHNALLFPIVQQFAGIIVKTIGDAIMAYFPSSNEALRAAAAMQQALESHNTSIGSHDEQIHIRIAMNAGVAIAQAGDIYGDVVNVAARIEHQAQADEILMSSSVSEPVKDEWPIESAGSATFKGKAEPIALFRLRWHEVTTTERKGLGLPKDFEIRQSLGKSPIGDSYVALDKKLGRVVAVTRMYDFIAQDAEMRSMLLGAAVTQAKLDATGVVAVYRYSDAAEVPAFVVTDHAEGMTLSKLLTKRGVPKAEEAVSIVQRVATVLEQVHAAGALHLDLEPDNIFVASDGSIRIANFGLSNLIAMQVRRGSNPSGNPAFMAPEALLGTQVSTRSDVYSLGALLYFLLSGRAPIEDATSLEGTMVAAQGAVVPLKRVAAGVPDPIVTVVGRAMAVLPRLRFAGVTELLAELRPFLSTDTTGFLRQVNLLQMAKDKPATASSTATVELTTAQRVQIAATAKPEALPRKILAGGGVLLFLLGLTIGVAIGRAREARVEPVVVVKPAPLPAPSPPAVVEAPTPSALRARMEEAGVVAHGDAYVVLEAGRPVVEWYATTKSPSIDLGRVSAPVAAAVLGRLVDSGKLKSLGEPMYTFFPEWQQGKKRAITLRHVLEHTTGIRPPGPDEPILPNSVLRFALAADLSDEPGKKKVYNPQTFNLIAGVASAAADKPLDRLFAEDFAKPLGIGAPTWGYDGEHTPIASSGLAWRALDLAKLGAAFVDGGPGHLLSEAWLEAANPLLFQRVDIEDVGAVYFATEPRVFWVIVPAQRLVAVRLSKSPLSAPSSQLAATVAAMLEIELDDKTKLALNK